MQRVVLGFVTGVLSLAGAAKLLLLVLFASIPPAHAEELPQDVTVVDPPDSDTHRTYVLSIDFEHGSASPAVIVVDGRSGLQYMTALTTTWYPQVSLSRNGKQLYVAATYFSRLNRGKREDVVEIYDTKTLRLQREIIVPPKRAESVPLTDLMTTSVDGRYLFVQNANPGSSVSIVDLSSSTVLKEVGTAGCWTIHPSAVNPRQFSTFCGDGKVVTITFTDSGDVSESKRSKKLFDPSADPLSPSGVSWGKKGVFVSFKGMVHVVDFSGPEAVQEAPWLLAQGVDATEGWRPGGWQMLAIDRKSGQLYVTMHKHGRDGSHREPADEIWVIDLKSRSILRRLDGNQTMALAVSQDDSPVLFTSTADKVLRKYDIGAGFKDAGTLDILKYGLTVVAR